MTELYREHRPTTWEKVLGQNDAVKMLKAMVAERDVPHAMMFIGPSGCGKTTLARILAKNIGCGDRDLRDMNCADLRGIDNVRDIRQEMQMMPGAGRCRVYIIDEAHMLTNEAQNAFLKILEDPPKHVYFMLCTTNPQKLIATVKTRCTEVRLKEVGGDKLRQIMEDAAGAAGLKFTDDVYNKIIENAEDSPRKALVMLDKVKALTDEEEQLRAIEAAGGTEDSIKLARLLINPSTAWKEVAACLKAIDTSNAEGLRHLVLSYCSTILLNGRVDGRVFLVMDVFAKNFYDTHKPGLVMACYEVINGG